MTAVPVEILRDLAPNGRIRAAINFGNPVLAQKNQHTEKPQGVSVDLAHELGRRLGVPVELITFDAAGKVFAASKSDSWDIAFLAIDPLRASEISFTAPYVIIEGTYLVREDSPLRSIADFDRSGVRVAVGRGAAYDLFLTRSLRQAQLIRADTGAAALQLFVEQELEAAAGVRQQLTAFAKVHGGLRVIDGHFTSIRQAMGTPKGRAAGAAYLTGFIEDMKASNFVALALARSGQHEASVPMAEPDCELPAGWLAFFDGERLTDKSAHAAVLTTVDSQNWAHTCFISAGEVLAFHDGRVYLAIWRGSRTAANLQTQGRASLLMALEGVVWEARMQVRCCDGGERVHALLVFEGRIVGVRRHAAPYAHVRHLVGFALLDQETTIARWLEQIGLLRRVAAVESAAGTSPGR